MAFSFGDGFDLYATAADALNGYWDSGSAGTSALVAGRFAGSRAITYGTGGNAVKSSGANDAVHHIFCAFQSTGTITGSTLGQYFEFFDGATAQCSIVFKSNGDIVLTAGAPAGTVLATYASAFTVQNAWYGFEFEVLISNTAGYMKVRKNGNSTEDFTSALNLDTQVSANPYANKLQAGNSAGTGHSLDDLFWRSDASSVTWIGEIRCYTRMPASDASVQFSRTPTSRTQRRTRPMVRLLPLWQAQLRYTPFNPTYSGTIGVATVSLGTGYTGNLKCSIFASSGTGPTTVVGTCQCCHKPGCWP